MYIYVEFCIYSNVNAMDVNGRTGQLGSNCKAVAMQSADAL